MVTARYIIKVKYQHFDNFKPTCRRVDNRNVGETTIIFDGRPSRMLLSYRLDIWTYQVYMHHIPQS